MTDHVNNDTKPDDVVQISRSEWEASPATTIGKTTKVVKSPERRGWKAVLVRQDTFDALKTVFKNQDKSKRILDLAGITDGMLGHMLSNPLTIEAGVAEGRARKRAEILASADEWAE